MNALTKRLKEKEPLIQIIMGPRQVGKTTGVLQAMQNFKASHSYFSMEDSLTSNNQQILENWQKLLIHDKLKILVIDEIQKVDNWAETIKALWDKSKLQKKPIKLVLLGSSSLDLQKGASESLAGRFELIPVYHWSYIESKSLVEKLDLEKYLQYGGYPASYQFLRDPKRLNSYLKNSIVDRVIDKDILYFASVKNPSLFRQAFEILCSYPSQEISYRKLLGQLQDKGNVDLIKYYISLFEGAFLFRTIFKFGSQEFKVKSSSPKIIPMAPCLYQLFSHAQDKVTFVFESTVGAICAQLTDKLYYWRQDNNEVDFVLVIDGFIYAIEVKSGRKKSLKGLNKFCELYPKAIPVIITKDNYEIFSKDPSRFLKKLS